MTLIWVWSRSCWLYHLRLRSVASWLLGSHVWVPLMAWMFVCCVCNSFCDELATNSEEFYEVCVCVCVCVSKCVWSRLGLSWFVVPQKKNMFLEWAQKWLLMLITKVISPSEIWTGCNQNTGVHCIVSLSAAAYLHRKPVTTLGSYESCHVQGHHKRGWIFSVLLNNPLVSF
jgi:hypothetical protein